MLALSQAPAPRQVLHLPMPKLLAWLRDEQQAGRGLAPASAVEEAAAELEEAAMARDDLAAEVTRARTRTRTRTRTLTLNLTPDP